MNGCKPIAYLLHLMWNLSICYLVLNSSYKEFLFAIFFFLLLTLCVVVGVAMTAAVGRCFIFYLFKPFINRITIYGRV